MLEYAHVLLRSSIPHARICSRARECPIFLSSWCGCFSPPPRTCQLGKFSSQCNAIVRCPPGRQEQELGINIGPIQVSICDFPSIVTCLTSLLRETEPIVLGTPFSRTRPTLEYRTSPVFRAAPRIAMTTRTDTGTSSSACRWWWSQDAIPPPHALLVAPQPLDERRSFLFCDRDRDPNRHGAPRRLIVRVWGASRDARSGFRIVRDATGGEGRHVFEIQLTRTPR